MRYIEAPNTYKPQKSEKSVFLAGGITGVPDWQQEVVDMLSSTNLIIFNPRRKDFPIDDPHTSQIQIKWEFEHLRLASAILFWFPCESICPIALYELGAWSMTDKSMFIGVHPQYRRRRDIEVQTKLARPDVHIVYRIGDLVGIILNQYK